MSGHGPPLPPLESLGATNPASGAGRPGSPAPSTTSTSTLVAGMERRPPDRSEPVWASAGSATCTGRPGPESGRTVGPVTRCSSRPIAMSSRRSGTSEQNGTRRRARGGDRRLPGARAPAPEDRSPATTATAFPAPPTNPLAGIDPHDVLDLRMTENRRGGTIGPMSVATRPARIPSSASMALRKTYGATRAVDGVSSRSRPGRCSGCSARTARARRRR